MKFISVEKEIHLASLTGYNIGQGNGDSLGAFKTLNVFIGLGGGFTHYWTAQQLK